MRVLVAVLLCAVAFGQASAWPMHHRKCHDNICNPRRWDRVFKTKGPNFIDTAKSQSAQKAFNTVLVQVLAAATTEGALPKGTRVAKVKALEGCYDSIVPGTLRGKQYKGEYEFLARLGLKVPGQRRLLHVHILARSYNRRHFPWFEMIEAYLW
jgi:hypothetical protein